MMGRLWDRLLVASALSATVAAGASRFEDHVLRMNPRRLEDAQADYFEYDISEFSLRFDKCQYVKMFDDELAEDEDSESPFSVNHFVVFRLCPSDACGSCSTVFGRYVAELEDYLAATVDAQERAFETMCDNCSERCNGSGEYCSGCGKLCYRYENLEDSGYIDASDFIQCQKLEMNNNNDENDDNQEAQENDENDDENEEDNDDDFQLYIGPRCSKNGDRILIGLFSDENCQEPYTDEEPQDYLGAKLSYHLLSHSNDDQGTICLSCKEDNDDENEAEEDKEDLDDVNEMCEEVYSLSAKCESKYGITAGFIQMNKEEGEYENQVENEFMACNFIESLIWNSYTETGEINANDVQDVVLRDITQLQKAAVSFLTLSVLGLLGFAYYLQKSIDNAFPKVDLACQSDNAQIS